MIRLQTTVMNVMLVTAVVGCLPYSAGAVPRSFTYADLQNKCTL